MQSYVGEITHGQTGTHLYQCWKNMKSRCYITSNDRYYCYGARGIVVCDNWHIFENFQTWALSSGYVEGLTIDRINVNGNYEPDNCRWLTYTENHTEMMVENLKNSTGIFSIVSKTKSKTSNRTNNGKKLLLRKGEITISFNSRGEAVEYLSKVLNRTKQSIKSHIALCLKGKSLTCGGYSIYDDSLFDQGY